MDALTGSQGPSARKAFCLRWHWLCFKLCLGYWRSLPSLRFIEISCQHLVLYSGK